MKLLQQPYSPALNGTKEFGNTGERLGSITGRCSGKEPAFLPQKTRHD